MELASKEVGPAETPARRMAALAIAAYFFFKLRGDLLNASLFPLVTNALPYARDVLTLTQALASFALLALALRRPAAFARPAMSVGALVAGVAGLAALLLDARMMGCGWLSAAGAIVMGAGTAWLGTIAMLACCRLGTGVLVVAVAAAMAASRACAGLIATLGIPAALATLLEFGALVAAFACSYPLAREDLARIAAGPAPSDAALAQPRAFVPLTSTLFVSLLLLKVAYGFTLRFNVSDGVIPTTAVTVATLGLLAILGALGDRPRAPEAAGGAQAAEDDISRERSHRLDALFSTCILLYCLGFLIVPIGSYAWLAADLLAASSACANALIDCVLIAAARRNILASVAVLSAGGAFTSIGVTLGANLGLLAGTGTGGDNTLLACALLTGALLAYTLFVMRGFSFGDTIEGIEPVRAVVVPEDVAAAEARPTAEEAFARTCETFARERALSPRELDVLELLARGRNNAYIQEELVLSRNTVKSHIRHVYTKLDVHSQQELIDLVEAQLAR